MNSTFSPGWTPLAASAAWRPFMPPMPARAVGRPTRTSMTMAVRMAPIGSLTIASFRNAAERRSRRVWRSSGRMTVGPSPPGWRRTRRTAPEQAADQVGGERSEGEVDGQRDDGRPQDALAGGPELAEVEGEFGPRTPRWPPPSQPGAGLARTPATDEGGQTQGRPGNPTRGAGRCPGCGAARREPGPRSRRRRCAVPPSPHLVPYATLPACAVRSRPQPTQLGIDGPRRSPQVPTRGFGRRRAG
jgi:hypothetical protein